MKIVYLDEAGKSKPSEEPYLVVVAVIIDGDKDTGPLAKELGALVRQYKLPSITCFHAKDIWHGSGVFDRDDPKWTLPVRLELFSKLAALPKKLNLPVAIGHIHRPTYKIFYEDYYKDIERQIKRPIQRTAAHILASEHTEAFVRAAKSVDTWMQKNARNEREMLIAENVSDIKRDLKLLHAIAQDRQADIYLPATETFKTVHIIETLHFAEKRESPFLQIADMCAFTAKRKLMKKADIEAHYKLIEPQIIRLNRTREPFTMSSYRYDDEEDQ